MDPSTRYGMRFISKVLKDTLHEKFPDATEDELVKVRHRLKPSPLIKLGFLPSLTSVAYLSLSLFKPSLSFSFSFIHFVSIATVPLFLSFIPLSFPSFFILLSPALP